MYDYDFLGLGWVGLGAWMEFDSLVRFLIHKNPHGKGVGSLCLGSFFIFIFTRAARSEGPSMRHAYTANGGVFLSLVIFLDEGHEIHSLIVSFFSRYGRG